MLGNWIKQTTTTTGTGALTLAQVTGYPRFADVLPDIGRLFYYTILNADGTPVESGMGKLTDATTLSRVKILATYASGAYANSNAAAVALAAGTYTVICAADESSVMESTPNTNAILTNGNVTYSSGTRWCITGDRSRNVGTTSPSTQFIFYIPFWLTSVVDAIALGVYVTTGAAGATCNLGMYTVNEKGAPGQKLFESGSLSLAATGLVSGTVSGKRLTPGYYFASIVVAGSATIRAFGSNGFDQIVGGSPVPVIVANAASITNYCFSENANGMILPTVSNCNDFQSSPAMILLGVR